jgi:transcriptional regulator with XRE-family HTH domain
MASARDDDQSGLALFAAELAAARAKAGLSRDELAARLNYSPSLVAMVEARRRAPTLDFARRCDEALATAGTFARMQQHARTTPVPSWFKPWAEIEATAAQLRLFEHSLVPGLLQTEDYAKAVLLSRPGTSAAETDELAVARIERQAILYRDRPPIVWAVVDEGVLRRQIGSAKVMHEQLVHLWGMADRPNVTIEVVPLSAGAHSGLMGAFAIAESDGMARAAYLETVTEGYISETPAVLSEVGLAFDTLRSEALPRGASKDLILKWAEDYDQPD